MDMITWDYWNRILNNDFTIKNACLTVYSIEDG